MTWETKFSINKFSYPFKRSAVLDIKCLCACSSVCPVLTATRMDAWVTQAVLVSGQWKYRQRSTSHKHSVPWCPPPRPEIRVLCQRAVKFYERETWPLQAWRCSQHSDIIFFFFQIENWKPQDLRFLRGSLPWVSSL